MGEFVAYFLNNVHLICMYIAAAKIKAKIIKLCKLDIDVFSTRNKMCALSSLVFDKIMVCVEV